MKFEQLTEGLSVNEALEAVVDGCGRKDTLFAPESWRGPRLEKLRGLLTEPVTNDQAEALRGAVLKQHQLDTVIRWLEWKPAAPWNSFLNAWNAVGLTDREVEMEYSLANVGLLKGMATAVMGMVSVILCLGLAILPAFFGKSSPIGGNHVVLLAVIVAVAIIAYFALVFGRAMRVKAKVSQKTKEFELQLGDKVR